MSDINLGSFQIPAATQRAIFVVFVIYSILVVGLGLFVQYQNRKRTRNRFAEFLTGGGGLNSLEVAMIAATAAMAGGVMISGPGLTYRDGFIYTLVCFTLFIMNFLTLGTYGKKYAIVRHRINAQTAIQMVHHRYQSRTVAIILALFSAVFLTINSGGQFLSAAKVFSTVLGTDAYTLGLAAAAITIVIYSLAGGVKSLAKVCVLQGMIMIAAVVLLAWGEYQALTGEYGSVQAAMEFVTRANSALVDARTYTPLQAIGLAFTTGWANSCSPSNVQVSMVYNKVKVQKRSIIMGCTMLMLINLVMATSGPIAFALNQNISNVDYSTIYLTTNLLPGWMAGIVTAAVFAAIQSSVASFMILIAGSLARDVYKDCINPKASDKTLSRLNIVLFVIAGAVAALIALKPSQLAQLVLILASGGIAVSYGIPNLFGAFWRKATAPGALAASLGGVISYIGLYFLSSSQWTAEWYAVTFQQMHPLILAVMISTVLMIAVSLLTPNHRVPLGVYKVWFCREYSDRYAQMYDACDRRQRRG